MPILESFSTLLSDPNPALAIKFSNDPEEEPIIVGVRNVLTSVQKEVGRNYFETINKAGVIDSFMDFCSKYDGCSLFSPYGNFKVSQTPLIQFIASAKIRQFTSLYKPGGDRAWIMDHNKTKSIYRGDNEWIAFAQVANGPSCLCMFLEGENAGAVFFAEPQPHFNTLKPIGKNFNVFLEKIAKDPAALLSLIRAYVVIKQRDDNNFGYIVSSYLSNAGDILPVIPENQSFWKRFFDRGTRI